MSLSLSPCLAVSFDDSVLMLPAMPFLPSPHLAVSWTKTDAQMPAAVNSCRICLNLPLSVYYPLIRLRAGLLFRRAEAGLGEWADRSLVRFSKDKGKVLFLGGLTPSSSSSEKVLWVLVGSKQSVRRQRLAASQAVRTGAQATD